MYKFLKKNNNNKLSLKYVKSIVFLTLNLIVNRYWVTIQVQSNYEQAFNILLLIFQWFCLNDFSKCVFFSSVSSVSYTLIDKFGSLVYIAVFYFNEKFGYKGVQRLLYPSLLSELKS